MALEASELHEFYIAPIVTIWARSDHQKECERERDTHTENDKD